MDRGVFGFGEFVRVLVVEKMWKNLRESLCGWGGKNCGKVTGWFDGGIFGGKNGVLHGMVEKFCAGFPLGMTGVNGEFSTVSTGLITTITNN